MLAKIFIILSICSISIPNAVVANLVLEDRFDYRLHMDQYLRERLSSPDSALNMRAAKEWLTDIGPDFSDVDGDALLAHANFLALNSIHGGTHCDSVGMSVLEYNLDYLGVSEDKEQESNKRQPAPRFDQVVLDLARKHGLDCRPVYKQMLFDSYYKLDENSMHLMDDFTDRVIEASPIEFESLNASSFQIQDKDILNKAFDLIAEQTNDKYVQEKLLDERKSVSYDSLTDLLLKYIGQPCNYYYQQTKHIFNPSSYDESILEDIADSSEYSKLYKLALIKYTVCAHVATAIDPMNDWLIDGLREVVNQKLGKKIDKPLLKRLFKRIGKDKE